MVAGDDEKWMREAITVARSKGSDPSTSPLGCVIVLDGKVIAAERNQTKELPDATAHAEMMAIRRACESTGELELRGATLYSTLQPCGMCTMASIWSKVGRVVYGAGRDDVHPMYFEAKHVDTLAFISDAYRDDIVIEGGCLAVGPVLRRAAKAALTGGVPVSPVPRRNVSQLACVRASTGAGTGPARDANADAEG